MSDITQILNAVESGESSADELLPIVYEELRKLAAIRMANEAPGQTLGATDLVHEAFIRLVGNKSESVSAKEWNGRGHFFGAAAKAMRRIVIDNVRKKKRQKRGGGNIKVELRESQLGTDKLDEEILSVHDSLKRLETESPELAKLVELRYFAGLTSKEAATALGVSKATADRNWAYARVWLRREIEND